MLVQTEKKLLNYLKQLFHKKTQYDRPTKKNSQDISN